MPCLFLTPVLLMVLSIMMTLWWIAFGLSGSHRRGSWAKAGVCGACGYSLAGLGPKDGVLLCPECGGEYRRRPAVAVGKAGWMWLWPAVLLLVASLPLTERWWYRALRQWMDSEVVLLLPNLASLGGLLAVVVAAGLSRHVRSRERLAMAIVMGVVQIGNSVSWSVWMGSVVADWG